MLAYCWFLFNPLSILSDSLLCRYSDSRTLDLNWVQFANLKTTASAFHFETLLVSLPLTTISLAFRNNIKVLCILLFQDLQEQLKNMSQERDEHKIKTESLQNNLKEADEGKDALKKEITDTKEELALARNELSQLKESLQVEMKEKEVC